MAAAQPIALPSSSSDFDVPIGSGSYTGQNGSFNPASYTRRLLGSPSSFRPGSFGSRFYPGMSPGQLLGPLDPNVFGKVSSSIESDRGSIMNAFNAFERQDEHFRDYQCCGVDLHDMHALVEHFEECHVLVVDPSQYPQQQQQQLPNGMQLPPNVSYFPDAQNTGVVPNYHQGSFDPDDMELDAENSTPSSGSSSPPDTPISTPLTSYPGHYPQLAGPSSLRPHPISAFDNTTVVSSRSGLGNFPPMRGGSASSGLSAQDPFNPYAGYSDYSSHMPGTAPSMGPLSMEDPMAYGNRACLPPALLLNTHSLTPHSSPSSSRVASPAPGSATYPSTPLSSSGSPTQSQASSARASTTLSRPASSLLLSKPFKCPKPNCNKSYKQANGLKYHLSHGSCNFAPAKDVEQIQALLDRKQHDGEPMTDAEMREVEKEAERRLRPYACGVGDCQRRYKNMNGLRYHYQHSGDHGAIGLALLASGQHECLAHTRSHARHVTPGGSSTSAAPSSQSSPRSTPTLSHQQQQHHLHQQQQHQQHQQHQQAMPPPSAYPSYGGRSSPQSPVGNVTVNVMSHGSQMSYPTLPPNMPSSQR